MLLTLIIILILIGAAVVGSIYSSFLVFYSNFSESENYHKAYYTSVSALERGELVVRQRDPGYVGSGGIILGVGNGNNSNDKSLAGFSYLGEHSNESTVLRSVNSRTTRIPATGKGNVESFLSADDSSGYNVMDYENAEVFLLYYDNSSGDPYTKSTTVDSRSPSDSAPQIQGIIRLPQKLVATFGALDDSSQSLGAGESRPKNDAMVDRQIRGEYPSTPSNIPFTIYSTQTANGSSITYEMDTVFREKDINQTLNYQFGNQYHPSWNPIAGGSHGINNPIKVISQKESEIKNLGFSKLFKENDKIQLRFNLLNLLKTKNGKIYPFLEYYADFGGKEVSDKYFTIKGEGSYKDYNVNIIFQKPTVKETVLSNFTSIF